MAWSTNRTVPAAQLRLAGVEFSGKSGTAQVIGYSKMSARAKRDHNSPITPGSSAMRRKRNPEICVAALVQESGQHGGEAAGPVVRDIVKAYYDKRTKRTEGASTQMRQSRCDEATHKPYDPAKRPAATVAQPVMKHRTSGTQTAGDAGAAADPDAARAAAISAIAVTRAFAGIEPRQHGLRLYERRTRNTRLRLVAARHPRWPSAPSA